MHLLAPFVASFPAKSIGGLLCILGFAAFAALLFKAGLAVARQEDQRKLQARQTAEERDRLAEAVPGFLREPPIPITHLVFQVLFALGAGGLGALLTSSMGATIGFGGVLVPGWPYVERDRRFMRHSAIRREQELRGTIPAAQHQALMRGLYAMYQPDRLDRLSL